MRPLVAYIVLAVVATLMMVSGLNKEPLRVSADGPPPADFSGLTFDGVLLGKRLEPLVVRGPIAAPVAPAAGPQGPVLVVAPIGQPTTTPAPPAAGPGPGPTTGPPAPPVVQPPTPPGPGKGKGKGHAKGHGKAKPQKATANHSHPGGGKKANGGKAR